MSGATSGGRPMIVGEANPYSRDPDDALLPYPAQSAGARFRTLLGWSEDEYLGAFERRNLLDGSGWSLPRAHAAADQLMRHNGPIILLGAKVAAAFDVTDLALWTWRGRFLRLPHPSGLSREWSKPGATERLRALMAPMRPRP